MSTPAARVLIVDERGRVLLARYRRADGTCWWCTPGGGTEPELRETGIAGVPLTPLAPRVTDDVLLPHMGKQIAQDERWFTTRVRSSDVELGADDAQGGHAVEGIESLAWWTPAQLAMHERPAPGRDDVFPRDLRARMVSVGLVRGDEDLEAVLAMQRANLEASVGADEARAQGFVTVVHTLEVLRAMHALAPSIVARAPTERGDAVVGYALVMPPETSARLPVLETMFARIRSGPFAQRRWYVMGQIAVAKEWRGAGVVDVLYAAHSERYRARWDVCITEVATRNARSLRAHLRVGFRVVDTYRDDVDEWAVVAWEW